MSEVTVPDSSVAPSDSVSQIPPKKKNRPGKNQRSKMANTDKGFTPPSSAAPSNDKAKVKSFSRKVTSDPVPQPGKFPVVFQTGAGEPTRDVPFAYSARELNDLAAGFTPRYLSSPKYAEFAAHVGLAPDAFDREVVVGFLLGLAQYTVHSHVNLGLPQGDFSSVSAADVFNFRSVSAVISQFGEFQVPSVGSRFLLADYATTVSSLVFAASRVSQSANEESRRRAVLISWLPMSPRDHRTRWLFAVGLSRYFKDAFNTTLGCQALADALFTGDGVPPWFTAACGNLPEADQGSFDFLFDRYRTEQDWATAFVPAVAQDVLSLVGLSWDFPAVGDLDFSFNAKEAFSTMAEVLARRRSAIVKFFSCVSGLSVKSTASGSPSQLSRVNSTMGVTLVETFTAVSAPEYSLLACFPPSVALCPSYTYDVVLTTAIPLPLRATEFQLLDWL